MNSHPIFKNVILIGYGNRLRNDDGVGQAVADAVAAWKLPHVRAIATHQLTPELVEMLATADLAIFSDAYSTDTLQIQVQLLEPAPSRMITGHCCEPQMLLAIAQLLYGYCPSSWLVKIPAINFSLGDRFSTVAQHGMAQALKQIEFLILQQEVTYA
ncbi:hydrogenase maturation protease [Gloeocapsopsis sp. IPPAS B-1203]|uniref:hydrogenase maturation protease n=1 Tax=Gloeocapsopsis sp. IPPAS B-1203 TaxID=2049454 RepID=UPI000C178A7C|nr:hydrogenase maturation protease [Gloeocapsopsis sp. IPPAS B-1203]PIG92317.1 hydrogenase maturation protease [Gloeocapsopsis sp. IPPAS B-1203]